MASCRSIANHILCESFLCIYSRKYLKTAQTAQSEVFMQMIKPILMPPHFFQDFKEKVEQSFESTGSATKQASTTKLYDFDRMGERKIIMASEETWTVWQEVFTKHESGALFDIDSNCLFNELTDKGGDAKKYKFSPMNSNQMKNLMGMDDAAVAELGRKICDVPPKVYLNKKPTRWTKAIPFAQWCTNKKLKHVLVREIVDRARSLEIKEAANVINKDSGDVDPKQWQNLKAALCISGFHMWVLQRVGLKWLKLQCRSGSKEEAPPDELLETLDRIMHNLDRSFHMRRCAKTSVCRWLLSKAAFDPQLYVHRKHMWMRHTSGSASMEYCEVGIMDFRLFPKIENMEINSGNQKILEDIREMSKRASTRTVHTWMVIFSAKRAAAVDNTLQEVFPDHKIRREARYVYCKGEPSYAEKNKDKVLYLQRADKFFVNSRLVESTDEVAMLSADEDEDLWTDSELYRTREVCRHENPMLISDLELRYEVYLRFIDKFCRDQGTVMLVFAGAKAISACGVSIGSNLHFNTS